MPSFGFGGGGTSNNGASYTGAAYVYSSAGSATGNLNISGGRPVSYDAIGINGTYSNGYPTYGGGIAYLNRSGSGYMYFSRWAGNGITVSDSEGYTWSAAGGGLQGTVYWSTVPAAIGTPTATTSTNVQGRIALSWTAPDNGGNGISNYRVFFQTSANGSTGWSALAEVSKSASTATSFNADGLTVGTYYRFYVNAVNGLGTATYSTVSAVRMAPGVPGAPTGLSATRSTTVLGSVDLSWTAPSVTAASITGYNVYATPSGGTRTRIATLTGTGTTYAATGLTQRLSYTFDVTARNAYADSNGTESAISVTSTAVASGVPSAPTLTTTVPSATDFALDLSWTVPTDTSGTLEGYYIYRTTSNSVYASIAAGTTTYSATNLVPGVAYSFYVRARNTLSDAASTVGVASNTTTNTPTGQPSAPGDITISTVSQVAGAIKFTWTPVVDTVSVNIYENTSPRTLIATVKGASYTLYGLTSGSPRSYVLSTNNAFGESVVSTPAITITPTSGSTQTLINTVSVTDTTNDTVYNGTYNLVTVGSNTFTYAKTNANVAETTVPVISGTTTFGEINNNTNDNISATAVAISTSGPTSSQFSYTKTITGTLGDIPSGTPVSSVVATNTTNALFNGTKVVAVPSAGTITYTVTSATVSSRAAVGSVTNKSNSTYNGIYFITGATETEFTYSALTTGNSDQATSASFGSATNLTNKNMYNADSLIVSGSPTYNKITYTPAPTTYNARPYAFSATTTAGDPGSGTFRLNNGTVASANRIYIDVLDSNGTNRATWIRDWDLSASGVKGRLIIKSGAGLSVTTIFTVTGATTRTGTNDTGYFTGVITYVSGAIPTVGATTITFIPEQNATVITPYGQIRKADSTAKLDVRYRSGWLG